MSTEQPLLQREEAESQHQHLDKEGRARGAHYQAFKDWVKRKIGDKTGAGHHIPDTYLSLEGCLERAQPHSSLHCSR